MDILRRKIVRELQNLPQQAIEWQRQVPQVLNEILSFAEREQIYIEPGHISLVGDSLKGLASRLADKEVENRNIEKDSMAQHGISANITAFASAQAAQFQFRAEECNALIARKSNPIRTELNKIVSMLWRIIQSLWRRRWARPFLILAVPFAVLISVFKDRAADYFLDFIIPDKINTVSPRPAISARVDSKHSEAIAELQKRIHEFPESWRTVVANGLLNYRAGRFEWARGNFNQALSYYNNESKRDPELDYLLEQAITACDNESLPERGKPTERTSLTPSPNP